MLHGEVPETVMYGETSDIDQFSDLGWYEWIYFIDNTVQFTDENIVLRIYLVPIIDIGPVLTAIILKKRVSVTYIHLLCTYT